ncbi:tape measure protein, partial [Alcaligenaceae bacterium Me47]
LRVDGADGIERARDALGRFTKASEGAERSTEKLGKGGRKAAEGISEADRAAAKASKSLAAMYTDAMRTAKGLVGLFALRQLQQFADGWSDMQSVVGASIGDMAGAGDMMGRLVDIANASYSPLSQTVDVYSRNVSVLKDLGKNAAQAADFTESLNHMLVLTATRGERAASVQNALSKAMAVGKLDAMGLETVLANGGEVAQALAKELNTTVNGLRAFASQGKFTGRVIADSVIKPLDDVRERAAEMPATLGDAFTRINTNLTE